MNQWTGMGISLHYRVFLGKKIQNHYTIQPYFHWFCSVIQNCVESHIVNITNKRSCSSFPSVTYFSFSDHGFRNNKVTATPFSFPRYCAVNLTLLLQKIFYLFLSSLNSICPMRYCFKRSQFSVNESFYAQINFGNEAYYILFHSKDSGKFCSKNTRHFVQPQMVQYSEERWFGKNCGRQFFTMLN